MSDFIEDGTGKGYRAKVSSDNRVMVSSVVRDFSSFLSTVNSDVYNFLLSESSLTVTTTGGVIMFLQNSSDKDILLSNIIGTTDGALKVSLIKNLVMGTIGNYNSVDPININFGSSQTADCISYGWDEVGDGITGLSNGTTFAAITYGSAGGITIPLTHSVVLTKGTNIGLSVQGIGATREVEFWITFVFADNNY